jgi:hypothetical protein
MRCPPFARSTAALFATMVAARVALAVMDARPMIASQGLALSWAAIPILAVLGWCALHLAARVGFADEWAARGPAWRWYALAAAVGIVYGVVSASGDIRVWATQAGDPSVREAFGTIDVHQRFPASIPFYWYGGAFIEIFLRLIALTALTWLLRLVMGRSRPLVAFWVANAVVSLYETSPFLANDLGHAPAAACPSLVTEHLLSKLYLANLLTGYLYRRSGLWTAMILRGSFYLVWHVTYGSFRPTWLRLFLG